MNCEGAQLVLSARMDGERVGARHAEAADVHTEACATCQAFAAGSAQIRRAVRIRAAEPVPDLVDPIMAAVAQIRTRPSIAPPMTDRWIRSLRRRPRHRRRLALAPAAAAVVAGMVLGSVLVGGPW